MIKKPEPLIYVNGSMSLLERKVFNFLLNLIKNDSSNSDNFYYTSFVDIYNILNIGSYKIIEKILENLNKYKSDIDILKDKKEDIILIDELSIYGNFKIKVRFPTDINEMVLMDKGMSFAYFDISEIANIRNKFSLIVYELIVKYYNPKSSLIQIPHLKIDIFRELMGLTDKYKTNYHLKSKVLDVAINEINDKTDFKIEYSLIKKNGSKKFNYVEFKFKKNKIIEKSKTDKKKSFLDKGLMVALVDDRNDKTPIGW